jgi:glutamate-1-semialdehyde 2,1-aminomutase
MEAEMTQRNEIEQELLAKASQYLPGSSTGNTNYPDELKFLVREGKGGRVWDVTGNEYVDWLMGSGPMILGHAHPAVNEAVLEAVGRGSTFFTTNEQAVLLAEELVRAVPCAEQVRFTTSGTDACFQAMRVARAFTGKEKILKFEGGFHGTSDYAMMSVFASASTEFPQAEPNSGGIPSALNDLMLISQFNDLDMTAAIIDAHKDEIAAVIVEPMQRTLAPNAGFLAGLRKLTADAGVLLIFDEVVTGFRLAYGGAQEFYGVTPDLCSVGKIMGGGYALAAVMGRADVMSVYNRASVSADDYVDQIGTLNGNPIACAAGLATLAQLRQEGVYDRLQDVGGRLRRALAEACEEAGFQVQSVGEDAVFDIYFADHPVHNYRDGLAADAGLLARLNAGLLEKRIIKSWPQKFYPSIVHTDDDVDETIAAIQAVVPGLRG